MKITVFGLRHLGSIVAACTAKHFRVTGLDGDETMIAALRGGEAPVAEPGLDELIAAQLETGDLRFTTNPVLACVDADVFWIACDTPLDDAREPDPAPVTDRIHRVLPNLAPGMLIILSSPLPVGTCHAFQSQYPQFRFASAPLNLRNGHGIEDFEEMGPVLIGLPDDSKQQVLERVFDPFTEEPLFLPLQSAVMTQHTANIYAAVATRIREIPSADHADLDEPDLNARAAL